MKKLLSILLAVLMLGGAMMVASSAAPGKEVSGAATDSLANFLRNKDLKNLSKTDINLLVALLEGLQFLGIDYKTLLNSVSGQLPIAVKAALHKAGLMKYPIWERSVFFNLIFKIFLFGWIWM